MDPISKDVALKFCEVCDWVYQSWVTRKLLFDDNNNYKTNIGRAAEFANRLGHITQEYCLLQLAKLHDPAIQGRSLNLTIDYMVRYGEWGDRKAEIERINSELLVLWKCLKPARNKTLAHNDMEALMAGAPIGSFDEGADDAYFVALQDLVNEVHEKWADGPYPFDDLAKADVFEFLALLEPPRIIIPQEDLR
jgi:hypothetical protein